LVKYWALFGISRYYRSFFGLSLGSYFYPGWLKILTFASLFKLIRRFWESISPPVFFGLFRILGFVPWQPFFLGVWHIPRVVAVGPIGLPGFFGWGNLAERWLTLAFSFFSGGFGIFLELFFIGFSWQI